ncbi:hypothetical protein BJV82DRAFT_616149 [Fennellomyces sp. T-0311]|nr:hypothetical protein BJV82DRAFT_616149 [Fennellomyces sp. T-0311]
MSHNTFVYNFDTLSQQSALHHQDEPQSFVRSPFSLPNTMADTPANAMVPSSSSVSSSQQGSGYDAPMSLHDDSQQPRYWNGLEQQVEHLTIHTPPTAQLNTLATIQSPRNQGGIQHDFVQLQLRHLPALRQMREQQRERFIVNTENRALRVRNASRCKCVVCNKYYHSKKQLHKHRREVHRM